MKFAAIFALATVSAVKLGDDDWFAARENGTGPLDKKYERVPPAHFAAGTDDLFMRSMIMNYALEGKDKDGAPTGVFVMNEA